MAKASHTTDQSIMGLVPTGAWQHHAAILEHCSGFADQGQWQPCQMRAVPPHSCLSLQGTHSHTQPQGLLQPPRNISLQFIVACAATRYVHKFTAWNKSDKTMPVHVRKPLRNQCPGWALCQPCTAPFDRHVYWDTAFTLEWLFLKEKTSADLQSLTAKI